LRRFAGCGEARAPHWIANLQRVAAAPLPIIFLQDVRTPVIDCSKIKRVNVSLDAFFNVLRRGAVGCWLLGILLCAASAQTPRSAEPALESSRAASDQIPVRGAEISTPTPDGASDLGSLLPRDLSPWGMFLTAHIVVKAVMTGLAFASMVTWTVAFAKALELIAAKRRLRHALNVLEQVSSLAKAREQLSSEGSLTAALEAAMAELRLSSATTDKASVKERVASRLERIEARTGRLMTRGTGVLATIGAIAPFVGLFGTVWGIMNSFINISKQHTTNLAVVAPGIAEALLATALGLFAAIPAVVIYNLFSRSIASHRALCADGTAEILRLVSRDLDRADGEDARGSRSSAFLSVAE
jgi:biopolymer transport protein ExbB